MSDRPIHPLEVWTRNAFGADFASLVLHGLLDEENKSEDQITVKGVDRDGRVGRKTLKVTRPLPERWGYKPLVLAALLKQLVGRPEIKFKLGFTFKALLADLFWSDIPQMWRVVGDALACYQSSFYSSDAADEGDEKRRVKRYPVTLITQLYVVDGSAPRRVQFSDREHTASFDLDFIEGLRQGKVVFAGTYFGELPAGRASVGRRQDSGGAAETAALPPESPFLSPGPRQTLLFEVTPVSPGPKDPWSKAWARAVGETSVSFDTGAKANAILRLVKRVATRHPPAHACPPESFDAVAEFVCRELDRRFREGLLSLTKTVALSVFNDVVEQGSGVIHSMPTDVSQGRRGPRPVWPSANLLVSSLERAVEAIEFDREWEPPKWVRLNRRWRREEVYTATVKLVVAYWVDKEGFALRQVDPSKMGRWLKSFGLPCFTKLRTLIRERIARRKATHAAFKLYAGDPYKLALYFLSLPFS